MILLAERPEPRALQVWKVRHHFLHRVDELHFLELLEEEAIARHEVPDLVKGVVQHEGNGIERVGVAQPMDEQLQQLRQ